MTEGIMDRQIGIGPIEDVESGHPAEVAAKLAFKNMTDMQRAEWARSLQGKQAIGKAPQPQLKTEVDYLREALKNQEEFFLNLLEIDRKKLRVQEITIDLLSGPLKDLAKVSGEVNAFGGANLSRSDSERVVSARRDAIDALRACGFQVSTVQELVDKEWREGSEFKLSEDESAMLKRAMARAGV